MGPPGLVYQVGSDSDTDIESIPSRPPSIKKLPPKLGPELGKKLGAKINFSLGDEDLDALNDDCKYLRHVSVGFRL